MYLSATAALAGTAVCRSSASILPNSAEPPARIGPRVAGPRSIASRKCLNPAVRSR